MGRVQGYYEVFISSGVVNGQPMPRHGRHYIRVAPLDMPGAIVAMADPLGGPDSGVGAAEITDVSVSSDGWTFFGFGAAGMAAAGIAAAIDNYLAPWEMRVSGPFGYVIWYADYGPPPSQAELARVEERLYLAQSSDDDEYTSASAEVERDVELFVRRQEARGLELIQIDLDRAYLGEVVEPPPKVARSMRKVVDRWERRGVLPDVSDPGAQDGGRIAVVREVYRDRPKRLKAAVEALRECRDCAAYDADDDPEAYELWVSLLVIHEVVAEEVGLIPPL